MYKNIIYIVGEYPLVDEGRVYETIPKFVCIIIVEMEVLLQLNAREVV